MIETSVPSAARPDTREARALELFRSRGHEIRRVNCKHVLVVGILVSKRRAARARTSACDGCGRRVRRSKLAEVVESLTFHAGDVLCPSCAASSDAETL